MSHSQRARNLPGEIADAYIEAVLDQGPQKVRVLDLAKGLGINKNSYYYYFSSKNSIGYWIFRRDVANMLDECIAPEHHVFLSDDEFPFDRTRYASFAYYARIPSGVRMLDQGEFFKQLVVYLRRRQQFYRLMFQDRSSDNLVTYMNRYYEHALLRDVQIIADGRYLPAETHTFLARSFTKLFLGMLVDLVIEPELPDVLLNASSNPFWNISAEAINEAIRNHPISRSPLTLDYIA